MPLAIFRKEHTHTPNALKGTLTFEIECFGNASNRGLSADPVDKVLRPHHFFFTVLFTDSVSKGIHSLHISILGQHFALSTPASAIHHLEAFFGRPQSTSPPSVYTVPGMKTGEISLKPTTLMHSVR